ncbi:unnamed protein product [Rotaria sp. Silwood1]|nr:unnamed protein product [Rotaria sp. Silwood1]
MLSYIEFLYVFSFVCTLIFSLNVFASDCDPSITYPPLNRPGPSYTVPRSNLSNYLKCYKGENHRKRWILFVPGSTEEVKELYSWNWMRIMDKKRWSYCTVQLPEKGLGDLQVAAEYIVFAIRKMYKKTTREKEKGIRNKTKINIIGHSLGGTLPRFAFRFWPDIRLMVNHLIAFGPTNHGTIMADKACSLLHCPIAVTQQRINSSFLCALNSYQETFSSIKYTNILSKFDEIVRPLNGSEINEKNVTNIYIQDLCPFRVFAEHLGAGIYDYCGYILTMNALRSRSLNNISAEKCCSKTLMPGINISKTEFLSKVAYSAEEHARHLLINFGEVNEEPELRCPFRTDCIIGRRKSFDIILLGMGPDGHTASLFPNHSVLNVNQGLVTYVKDSPKPPPERVTLTLNAINEAKYKIAVVTGESKSNIVKEIIEDKNRTYPIGQIENLIWYLDKAAASKLEMI